MSEYLECPFCDNDDNLDFDKEGLAYHLQNYCPEYDAALQAFYDEKTTKNVTDKS